MGVAGAQNLDHLGLGFRVHHEIGLQVIHLRLQDRRIPEEIPAFRPDGGRVLILFDMGKGGLGGGDIGLHGPRQVVIRWSSSA
jgi:hypothetical protein